jgi:hypothetical protein
MEFPQKTLSLHLALMQAIFYSMRKNVPKMAMSSRRSVKRKAFWELPEKSVISTAAAFPSSP